MEAEQQLNPQSFRSEGLNYYQQAQNETALKIRLETDHVLETIEMYLSGLAFATDGDKIITIKEGKPKANVEGVRAIMQSVKAYINSACVQGNLNQDQINMIMQDYHRGMANLLGFHSEEWNINRDERKSLVNFIEPFVFMFISRTKDNKERESYGMQIRSSDSQTVMPHNKNPLAFWK